MGAHPGSCTGLPLLILVRNSYEIHVNVVRPFLHIPFRFRPVDSRVKLARTFYVLNNFYSNFLLPDI